LRRLGANEDNTDHEKKKKKDRRNEKKSFDFQDRIPFNSYGSFRPRGGASR
jgi:hypothetical protein